jgi:hypothetical protein
VRGGMVSTLGLARDTETPDIARDETPLIRANLALAARSLSGAHWVDCSERGQRRETRKLRRSGRREVGWPMRASRRATIPTANATDIAPTRFSAASQLRFIWPGRHPEPRTTSATPTCAQVMATTTLAAPRVRISGRRKLELLI